MLSIIKFYFFYFLFFLGLINSSIAEDYSLSFNGTNEYVSVPFDSTMNPSGNFSVSAWVKLSNKNAYRSAVTSRSETVNGKKVNIASYQVKEEDTIEIRDKSKQLALIDIALANKEREVPEYLQLDEKNKKVKFVRVPSFEEVPYPVVMEPNLVIEYYSR